MAGISGYLLNEASAPEVIAAIRAVSQGAAVCPPQLCQALFKSVARSGSFVPGVQKMDRRLTRRQQELMPMIARGLTNKEIGSQCANWARLARAASSRRSPRLRFRIAAD
jgi:DNA-binding NarL/FixJ family response regulator